MYGFEFVSAPSVEDANELLTENGRAVSVIAGGTDLLGEIKQGTIRPAKLVSLQAISELKGVRIYDEGALIGAMTTLAEIAGDEVIRLQYAALAEACDSVATPQIRNVGTIGGNLCQRPRCWYYRSAHFDCLKKGGDSCFAFEGANKFHAIFDTGGCPAVHPSDTAVALTALDARALLISGDGARMMHIEDFFTSPDVDVSRENTLQPGEILAEMVLPTPRGASRSVFLKAKERQAMDFALASVALCISVEGDTISWARLALGGVAPVPWRVIEAEEALAGSRVADVDSREIGSLAVRGAAPLSDNGYKVRLTSGLVTRAVRTLLHDSTPQGA